MKMPSKFSTLGAALQRTGLHRELERRAAITGWAPTNQAFRQLGCQALSYLFSQEGTRDLRKILEYHFTPELLYTSEFEVADVGRGAGQGFRHGGSSEYDLERPRHRSSPEYESGDRYGRGHGGYSRGSERGYDRHYDRHERGRGLNGGRRRGQLPGSRGEVMYLDTFLGGERLLVETKPSTRAGDNIRINDEAHVLFSDIPAENGVFHAIDHVLLPENLNIPDYDWFDNEDQCDF
ncbi:beta-Ig-H3/fasciclin [Basidiobolus meristosporus CBS 931.73]|uniref:Beta-Ig-H3/fasciclin n=1 Tax=Basidiobolus meristosporus CBS 931.73 TaxID=1314790 RepID=A0A1Y1YCK6_9FUNG|nr:beta-Ig-H3/fasciclin [Basidiobolus meristosporus CBS 931.73]ORX95460.1 beta-Ig-H3/fasciclin [Basidiobolus meristosporus CBS 931.73]|eukprot:ORX95456.1 beta-Ig-H3/fasciclin [Basidiobolus meristosporus CBS 931.73]